MNQDGRAGKSESLVSSGKNVCSCAERRAIYNRVDRRLANLHSVDQRPHDLHVTSNGIDKDFDGLSGFRIHLSVAIHDIPCDKGFLLIDVGVHSNPRCFP